LKYDQLTIFPAHFFIPRHYAGRVYHGSGPVFADQAWGSTHNAYSKDRFGLEGWSAGRSSSPPPKVTVGMPTRNQCQWLKEALDSALAQDYPNFEVLVVDDESEDATPALLDSMKDPRLRVLRKRHTNLPDVRNLILREAAGEYICWLDSDDILLPGVLQTYSRRVQDWPGVSVFYGNLIHIDKTGRIKGQISYDNHAGNSHLLARLFIGNHMPNPGAFVQADAMREVGGFDEETAGSCDYDLWLRLAAKRAGFLHVGCDVVKYRWHGNNMSFRPEHIRPTDLYILSKAIRTIPLNRLCSDLPWENPSAACLQAFLRVGAISQERGAGEMAKLFAEKASIISKKQTYLSNCSKKDQQQILSSIMMHDGRPLCTLSNELFETEFVDTDKIQAEGTVPVLNNKPMSKIPVAVKEKATEPTAVPCHREVFLLAPDWDHNDWVKVVLSYVFAFKPGEPVGLLLVLEKGCGQDVSSAQDKVVRVLSMAKQKAIPDIIFMDQMEDLLSTIKNYDKIQWIRQKDGNSLGLTGEHGIRLASAYDLLSKKS
jgi:GT2 family glycosyltransferase